MKGFACGIIFIVLLSSIGIGYAYASMSESVNSFGSDYCSITPSSDDVSINQIKVKEFEVESETIPFLGFSSNGTDFQETLSLNYVHTKGTDILLTIEFSCTALSESPVIKCISNGTIVGSTLLTGCSVKTGVIAGIVLPLNGSTVGIINLQFQVEGINLDTPVEMSFSVHPLEVSS